MEFSMETMISTDNMSILKDDDSPRQQINEQSLAEDLEKNRECTSTKFFFCLFERKKFDFI